MYNRDSRHVYTLLITGNDIYLIISHLPTRASSHTTLEHWLEFSISISLRSAQASKYLTISLPCR